jgi:hypothetical protein
MTRLTLRARIWRGLSRGNERNKEVMGDSPAVVIVEDAEMVRD